MVNKFKRIFEDQKHSILMNERVVRQDLVVNADDRPDEIDQATMDIAQAMRMRLRNREVAHLRNLEEALRRIEEGVFGECENCNEDIESRRLEARPTAILCVACKEEEERRETLTATGHRMIGSEWNTPTVSF